MKNRSFKSLITMICLLAASFYVRAGYVGPLYTLPACSGATGTIIFGGMSTVGSAPYLITVRDSATHALVYVDSSFVGATDTITGIPPGPYIVESCGGAAGGYVFVGISISLSISGISATSCPADSGSISLLVSGSSPSYQYLWSSGATTATATHLGIGSYSVTVTDQSGCIGTVSATVPPIAGLPGSASYMVYQDLAAHSYLVANVSLPSSTASVLWQWSDGSIDTVDMGAYTHTDSMLSAVPVCLTVFDSNGCNARFCDSTSLYVVLHDSVSITSTSSLLCPGASVVLSATDCSGCTFAWSTGGTTSQIVVSAPGIYTVTVTQDALSVISSPFTLRADSITALFTLIPDTAVARHWYAINSSSGNFPIVGYIWSWGDGSVDSSAYPSHTYSSPGYYSICVTAYDNVGCAAIYCDSNTYIFRSSTAMVDVTVVQSLSSGIEDVSISSTVKVYPNPTSGRVMIEIGTAQYGAATLYDQIGRAVKEIYLSPSETELDLSGLNVGVYILSIKGYSGKQVRIVLAR